MDKELVIKEKESLINDLEKCNKDVIESLINYRMTKSRLWLKTDFEEKIGKKRPTVDEKKSYVDAHSILEKQMFEEAKSNRDILLMRIKLCEDKLIYV